MDAISKWAKKKEAGIALVSISIASATEAFYQLVKAFRDKVLFNDTEKLPPLYQWLALYKNHRQVEDAFKGIIRVLDGHPQRLIEYDDHTAELLSETKLAGYNKFTPEGKDKVPLQLKNEIQVHITDGLDDLLKSQVNFLAEEVQRQDHNDIPDEIFNQPEILFGFKVTLPCWLLHRKSPTMMLRKARMGNIDDIERLLRIDPSALFDKKISEYFHQSSQKANQFHYNEIIKALQKPPRVKITRQKIKMNLAGLISVQTEKLGYRLNEPEIRSLYDAIAQDKGVGDIDIDMPDSPESLKKAVQRERKFWLKF